MPTLEKIQGAIIGGAENRVKNLEVQPKLVTGTASAISAVTADVGTLRFATDTGNLMVSQGSGNWVSPSSWANGTSISLDGTNDHMLLSSTVSLGTNWTVAFWLKTTDTGLAFVSIDPGATNDGIQAFNNSFYVMPNSWTNGYWLVGNYTARNMADDIFDGNWHHLAFCAAGTSLKIYLDGAIGSFGGITDRTASNGTPDAMTFSQVGKKATKYLGGNMDELAAWSSTLDAANVAAVYNSGSPIDLASDSGDYDNSGNLEGYWRFEGGSNGSTTPTEVTDESGNSKTGTLTNSPTYATDIPA